MSFRFSHLRDFQEKMFQKIHEDMEIECRKYFNAKCDLVLDERKKHKNGDMSVSVRIYSARRYAYIKTGLRTKSWKTVSDEEKKRCISIYEELWDRVKAAPDGFNPRSLREKKQERESFNAHMQDRIDRYVENNQFSCAAHYRSALEIFTRLHGDVSVSDLAPQLFIDMKRWMESKHYSSSTIKIYLSDMKAVANWLRFKKKITDDEYPFKLCIYDTEKVTIPKGRKRTECYLDKEQVRLLWDDWKERGNEFLALWLFSYLAGGMNIADALRLTYDAHWTKTNGTELMYRRHKTRNKNEFSIIIPVTEPMRELIESFPTSGDSVFPYLADCTSEKQIKNRITYINNRVSWHAEAAARRAGIKERVTSTWARHSFATVMNREGVPYNYIEYQMGHANNGVSSHYIGGYTHEQMQKFSSLLL